MLKRKITNELLDWKNSKKQECLLVKGARQVGKTYIIKQFGQENYKQFYYLNFLENPEYMDIFEGSLSADEIYKRLSVFIQNFKIIENDTLIFLDEIQECPNARTALKFLAIDKRCDVIASGSLLGISYKPVPSFPVGYERQITMYSLDFEEFLWATGMTDESIAYVKTFFDTKTKVNNAINDKMFEKLREFIVVGGMPEVVNSFVGTNNFLDVHNTQQKIIDSYKDDIIKYAETTDKPKIRNCYLSIPRQLAKENKKFQYSVVEKGSTSRKYGDSIQWLVDACLVNKCYNVNNPMIPLQSYEKSDYFKIYLNDIGLLVSMLGFDTKQLILTNKISGPAKGGIYENLISDMLVKKGYKLNFYKPDDNSQEIEFLIVKDMSVIPIEVKAGNSSTVSLNEFIKNFKPPYAYKLITGNLGVVDQKITLPLYMAMFL